MQLESVLALKREVRHAINSPQVRAIATDGIFIRHTGLAVKYSAVRAVGLLARDALAILEIVSGSAVFAVALAYTSTVHKMESRITV